MDVDEIVCARPHPKCALGKRSTGYGDFSRRPTIRMGNDMVEGITLQADVFDESTNHCADSAL